MISVSSRLHIRTQSLSDPSIISDSADEGMVSAKLFAQSHRPFTEPTGCGRSRPFGGKWTGNARPADMGRQAQEVAFCSIGLFWGDLLEGRIWRASGRGRVYKQPTDPPSGALRVLPGKYFLPDARNETLRPRRVRRVFVSKRLNHHPLLRADAKRAENRERDQVRRTCHPIRDDERLADGIQC